MQEMLHAGLRTLPDDHAATRKMQRIADKLTQSLAVLFDEDQQQQYLARSWWIRGSDIGCCTVHLRCSIWRCKRHEQISSK